MNLYAAHTNWATRPADERFPSLTEMRDAVAARAASHIFTNANLERAKPQVIDHANLFVVPEYSSGTPMKLTHWSAGQVLQRLGLPRTLLARLSPDAATTVLRDLWPQGFSLAESEVFPTRSLVSTGVYDKAHDTQHPHTILSVVSDRYTLLPTLALLDAALPLVQAGKWRNPVAYNNGEFGAPLVPSGLYASDHDMFAFLIDGGDAIDLGRNGRRSTQLHRGIFISNSEVGARSFQLQTFYFDMVCGNNIVWGARHIHSLRARHTGERMYSTSLAALRSLVDMLLSGRESAVFDDGAFIKAALDSQDGVLAPVGDSERDTREQLRVFSRLGFTKAQVAGALVSMRQEERGITGSRWDWVQGFTAVARTSKHTDERLELDQRAAALLSN